MIECICNGCVHQKACTNIYASCARFDGVPTTKCMFYHGTCSDCAWAEQVAEDLYHCKSTEINLKSNHRVFSCMKWKKKE